jgi:hypothetical protein
MAAADWEKIQGQLEGTPLAVPAEIKLTASDGAVFDRFGSAVAVAGDVAIVGMACLSSKKGAAYVFERNAGGTNAWGQVRKLTASDGTTNDYFGRAVAVAGDVISVGAYQADPGPLTNAGAVYVFERNAGGTNNWGQVWKLTAADGAAGDQFGVAVAVAGDVILVGANYAASYTGVAYIFERNAGGATNNWGQVRKLTAADGAMSDFFGTAVATDGDTAMVGAYLDNLDTGSAYIYERNAGGTNAWGQVRKLVGSDAAGSAYFGCSVAVRGNVAIAGAYGMASKGAAYVFERNAGGTNNWGEVGKLTAPDGAGGDAFGRRVALAGNQVCVGADGASASNGAAYLFNRHTGGTNAWGIVRKLTAAAGAPTNYFGCAVALADDLALIGEYGVRTNTGAAHIMPAGLETKNFRQTAKRTAADVAAFDLFGNSVAADGDVAIAGASGVQTHTGAAYIFERHANGTNAWGQVRKLTAADGGINQYFGIAVAVAGDVALAGARGVESDKGAAYVFERNAGGTNNWGSSRKVTAADGMAGDYFGISAALAGDAAIVGAEGDDTYTGAAYVYERNAGGTNNWAQVRKLTAADAGTYAYFGNAVALAGDAAVVGSYQKEANRGAAYVFERNAGGTNRWAQVRKLTAADIAPQDFFGYAVAVDGNLAIVGAPGAKLGIITNAGAAYLFERNAGGTNNWGQVRKLTAADPAPEDAFGKSVSIKGDLAFVNMDEYDAGYAGAVYVFERNAGGTNAWGQIQKLTAPTHASQGYFGRGLSAAGDLALIGASGEGAFEGAIYLFETIYEAPSANIAILGTNGATIANGEAASIAKGTDFGTLTPGPSLTNTLSVTNAGTATLTISGVTTGGTGAARFRVSGVPATVTEGTASNFSLVFDASAEGVHTALVAIANSSAASNYSFNVQGAVLVAPAITADPQSLTNNPGSDASFSVSATGTAPLYYQWQKNTAAITAATNATYTIAAVAAGDAGNYRCVVSNLAGAVTSATANLTVNPPPNAPATLAASDGTYTDKVALAWSASAGALAYAIFRSAIPDTNAASQIGTATVTNFDDATATLEIVYYYWVAATNAAGRSGFSPSNTGWRAGAPVPYLPAPTNLAASSGAYWDKVRVTWSAVTNATSYIIFRNLTNDSAAADQVGFTDVTAYDDTGAPSWPETPLYYWVKAANAQSTSVFSASARGFCSHDPTVKQPLSGDFDGDFKNDLALYQESSGIWSVKLSASGYASASATFGGIGYQPIAKDFDGDLKADLGTYDEATGDWAVMLSASDYGIVRLPAFGGIDYTTVVADFDGDRKADPAVYLPAVPSAQPMQAGEEASGKWQVKLSGSDYGTVVLSDFGGTGYTALALDFDGDLKADPGIYEAATGNWTVKLSASGYTAASVTGLGGPGYLAVAGDYDGDGKADPAIYLPAEAALQALQAGASASGDWTVLLSASEYITATLRGFGGAGYAVAVGDFDGDGLVDPALYQASTSTWYVKLSSQGYATASAQQ